MNGVLSINARVRIQEENKRGMQTAEKEPLSLYTKAVHFLQKEPPESIQTLLIISWHMHF